MKLFQAEAHVYGLIGLGVVAVVVLGLIFGHP